jgi:integrase
MPVDASKYLDDREVEALLDKAENRALKDLRRGRMTGVLAWAVVATAINTGLRVSELAALKVEDIDLRKGSLYVLRQKRRRKSKSGPKQIAVHNAKPVRETLAIDPEFAERLKDYLEARASRIAGMEPEHAKGLTDTTGALFIGQRGPLGVQGLQQAWNAVAKKTNVMRMNSKGKKVPKSIHSARHTMGVSLLRRTGNLYQVQRQLGHASPATTANFYCDIPFEDMQKGVTGLFSRKKQDGKKR